MAFEKRSAFIKRSAFMERVLFLTAVTACLLTGAVAPAEASWLHHQQQDSDQPGTTTLKTASNKKIKISTNGLKKPVWNRFGKHARYMHHMEKASKAGGYAVMDKPAFADTMWSSLPKVPHVAHALKPHMPHMPHRNGAPARPKLAGKRHWLW